MRLNKKGQIGSLQNIVLTLVVLGIVLGVGFLILSEFKDQMTSGSDAFLGVNDTITALRVVPDWLDIIIIVAIAGIILGLVFYFLPRGGGTRV